MIRDDSRGEWFIVLFFLEGVVPSLSLPILSLFYLLQSIISAMDQDIPLLLLYFSSLSSSHLNVDDHSSQQSFFPFFRHDISFVSPHSSLILLSNLPFIPLSSICDSLSNKITKVPKNGLYLGISISAWFPYIGSLLLHISKKCSSIITQYYA